MGETIVEVVYNLGKLWRWCTTKENSVEVVYNQKTLWRWCTTKDNIVEVAYNPGKYCGGGVQSRKKLRRWCTIQENIVEVVYSSTHFVKTKNGVLVLVLWVFNLCTVKQDNTNTTTTHFGTQPVGQLEVCCRSAVHSENILK